MRTSCWAWVAWLGNRLSSERSRGCGKQETQTSNLLNTGNQRVPSTIVLILVLCQHQKQRENFESWMKGSSLDGFRRLHWGHQKQRENFESWMKGSSLDGFRRLHWGHQKQREIFESWMKGSSLDGFRRLHWTHQKQRGNFESWMKGSSLDGFRRLHWAHGLRVRDSCTKISLVNDNS